MPRVSRSKRNSLEYDPRDYAIALSSRRVANAVMITGYNTDVKHRGTVFHVQTEDKGLPAAWVETLIFVGGMVVVRRKRSYRDLVEGEPSPQVISKALEDQHRAMIAEIRLGKVDQQFEKLTGKKQQQSSPPPTGHSVPPQQAATAPDSEQETASSDSEIAEANAEVAPVVEPPHATTPEIEPLLSLDEVILDYLTTEEEHEHLRLVMDSDDDLVLGSDVKFAFRTLSDPGGRPILGASVLINFISTVAEPLLLAEGRTDKRGVAELSVALPAVRKGKGALIITAKSPLGNAEIKHLL